MTGPVEDIGNWGLGRGRGRGGEGDVGGVAFSRLSGRGCCRESVLLHVVESFVRTTIL